MNRKISIALFIVIVIGQIGVIGFMLGKVAVIKQKPITAYLSCGVVDPYDPLRGRYVIVTASQNTVYSSQIPSLKNRPLLDIKKLAEKKVYCILSSNLENMGNGGITDIKLEKPGSGSAYVEANVWSIEPEGKDIKIYLRLPNFNYYIQEDYAQKAANILSNRKLIMADRPIIVLEFDQKMNYLVKEILIGNMPIEKYIQENSQLFPVK
jgi:hypothetical protein